MADLSQGNPIAQLGAIDFYANLVALLPPAGLDGNGLTGPLNSGFWQGVGEAFGDLHAAAAQMSEIEMWATTTQQLLPEWELDYGIPDTCTPLGATAAQQRGQVVAKIQEGGGNSEAYFIAVAAALGYTISITNGAVGSNSWTITASAVAPDTFFTAGASVAGDVLEDFSTNTQLECIMRRLNPAHLVLSFNYV